MQAMYHFAKNNYRKFSHWHSSSVVLTHTTCTWGLHYIFRSGLSAFFIIADFFCCADLPYFRYQIRTREVLRKNMMADGWMKKATLCSSCNLFYFLLHCSWAFCKPLLSLKLSNCPGCYCVSMQNCVQKMFLEPFIYMLATVCSCVIVWNVWLDRL